MGSVHTSLEINAIYVVSLLLQRGLPCSSTYTALNGFLKVSRPPNIPTDSCQGFTFADTHADVAEVVEGGLCWPPFDADVLGLFKLHVNLAGDSTCRVVTLNPSQAPLPCVLSS